MIYVLFKKKRNNPNKSNEELEQRNSLELWDIPFVKSWLSFQYFKLIIYFHILSLNTKKDLSLIKNFFN
jgi:hypothetical protein